MNMHFAACLVLVSGLVLPGLQLFADPSNLNVAQFDEEDRLIVPVNFDEWVFIGSSLGMGYSQADFDPESPGMFQVVRMEPEAFRAFRETGRFAEGTMIALHFYGSESKVSINRTGYVMDDLHFVEIHLKDSARFEGGFNFYGIGNGQDTAEAMSLPNDCVSCHTKDGAYDGVFVQFYPVIHPYLPREVRQSISSQSGESAH